MILLDVILGGLVLGGMYALIAIGFNLQYGIARVLNLAYGEFLVAACFAAYWMFTLWRIDPILGLVFSVPVTFAANWLDLSGADGAAGAPRREPRSFRRRNHPFDLWPPISNQGQHDPRLHRRHPLVWTMLSIPVTICRRQSFSQPGSGFRHLLRVRGGNLSLADAKQDRQRHAGAGSRSGCGEHRWCGCPQGICARLCDRRRARGNRGHAGKAPSLPSIRQSASSSR